MKMKLLSCLALFCACHVHAYDQVQNQVTDKATGAVFPAQVSFDYQGKTYELEATGVSTRKKLVFKVYSVAHYLQKGAAAGKDRLQEILSDANAKQLTIKWMRDVPAAKVQEGYEESFRNAIPEPAYSRLQTVIKTYIAFFGHDVTKGEETVIRWVPGGTVEVLVNGEKVGTVANAEFAKGLWNVWFGNKSVVNRDSLISLMQ